MKLTGPEGARFAARPDPACPAVLIHGTDPMRVALRRQALVAALIGPQGEAEMRLTRLSGGDLRRNAAALNDVLVEDAADGATAALADALAGWQAGDAMIVVQAGALAKTSSLRKLVEAHPAARAMPVYDDPPDRAQIEAALRAAGIAQAGAEAMAALTALAGALDPGDFRQTVEKIRLYKHADPAPLTADEVAQLAPATVDAALDDLLNATAEARAAEIGPLMARLAAQGTAPVRICIGAQGHFRTLHAIAVHPQGPSAGIGAVRPPPFGARRDALARQARAWTAPKAEEALSMILDTDLTLRSASKAPQMALVERLLIRLAMLGR
jgi:DNA polymerase-3 subunit delta